MASKHRPTRFLGLLATLTTLQLHAADDGRLSTVLRQFERAKEEATQPLAHRLRAELEQLKRDYGAAGDAEMVQATQQQIDALEIDTAPVPVVGEWKWASGGSIKFDSNGIANHTRWSSPGSWVRLSRSIIRINDGERVFIALLDSEKLGWVTLMGQKSGTKMSR